MYLLQYRLAGLLLLFLTSFHCGSAQDDFCRLYNTIEEDFDVYLPGDDVPIPRVCKTTSCQCNPTRLNDLECSFCYDKDTDTCYQHGDTIEKDGNRCRCTKFSVELICFFNEYKPCNGALLTRLQGSCFGPKFPYVCDEGTDELVYPYCEYSDTASGDTICARDSEFVIYVDSRGRDMKCECTWDSVTNQATSSCSPAPQRNSPPAAPPTGAPTAASGVSSLVTSLWLVLSALANMQEL